MKVGKSKNDSLYKDLAMTLDCVENYGFLSLPVAQNRECAIERIDPPYTYMMLSIFYLAEFVGKDAYTRAYNQAAKGKGKKRHANGEKWTDQLMFKLADRHGVGFLTGQAEKKIQESFVLEKLYGRERAEEECLGAMVYLAAAIVWDEQRKGENHGR